jgi:hypothetical protein
VARLENVQALRLVELSATGFGLKDLTAFKSGSIELFPEIRPLGAGRGTVLMAFFVGRWPRQSPGCRVETYLSRPFSSRSVKRLRPDYARSQLESATNQLVQKFDEIRTTYEIKLLARALAVLCDGSRSEQADKS